VRVVEYPSPQLFSEIEISAITINIPDEDMLKLQEIAARLGVSTEELARMGIEEVLARSEDEFKNAADYVLQKNAELYRRLA